MKFETLNNVVKAEESIPQNIESGVEFAQLKENITHAEVVRRTTDEIEYRLEHPTDLEPFKKGIHGKKIGGTGNWLRGVLAAGVLLTGESVKVNAGEPSASAKTSSASRMVTISSQNEKALSPEAERQMFIEKTGYDMTTIAGTEFKVGLDVDNGTGPYIVHIGQFHYQETAIEIMTASEKAEAHKRIISIQKNIERVLSVFYSHGNNSIINIYMEGMLEDAKEQSIYTKCREILANISPKPRCFIEVLKSFFQSGYSGHSDYTPARIALVYLHRQKLKELRQYFISHPVEYSKAELEFNLVEKNIINQLETSGQDEIYLAGAAHKLAVEGKAILKGIETESGNKAPAEVQKEQLKFLKKYKNMSEEDQAKMSELEHKEFMDKGRELIEKFNKTAMDDREDIAVDLVAKGNLILKQKTRLLIFGTAHKLKRAVLEHNKNNPEEKMGLVTLTSNEPENMKK